MAAAQKVRGRPNTLPARWPSRRFNDIDLKK
jgi:hypothetical protein